MLFVFFRAVTATAETVAKERLLRLLKWHNCKWTKKSRFLVLIGAIDFSIFAVNNLFVATQACILCTRRAYVCHVGSRLDMTLAASQDY